VWSKFLLSGAKRKERIKMSFVEIIEKALQSHAFALKIIADPEAALTEVGVVPTPDKLKALREASHALMVAKTLFDHEVNANI
jgi:hypothetical protein